jgi:4-diphosphocytidyl-2-C-methyl-D-erythritol kinase
VVATRGRRSTPEAFADWDKLAGADPAGKLTAAAASDRINACSHSMVGWLSGSPTGVPARKRGGDRAEALLLDLVRTGIENDFEQVVFPQYPELRREGVCGQRGEVVLRLGSAVYGLFAQARRRPG